MNRTLLIVAPSLLLLGGGLLLMGRKARRVGGKLFEHAAPAGTTGVQIGEFFSLPEFTASTTARARGIDNMPTPQAIVALRGLTTHTLDPLRRALGKYIRVTSGFRSPALNAAIGGSATSQHMKGEAVDIMVNGMTGIQLAKRMLDLRDQGIIKFDQLVWYHKDRKPHVHVSYKPAHRDLVTYAPPGHGYTNNVDPRTAA
jgi:zinc D-Ala-D-Ala carboxypeptidase